MSDERSREARARAERALVELALAFGHRANEIVVIGGLNPDFLAPTAPVPHLGTTDVDILLELGFVYDRDELDYSWLPPALEVAGFTPRSVDAWQWDRTIRDGNVRIDLLCDVPDNPSQSIALPGTDLASAKNLPGPSAALRSPVLRSLRVDDELRERYRHIGQTIDLRFASLGGYLLAKASALNVRGKVKDAYDLMYVALYCTDGVNAAFDAIVEELADAPSHIDHARDIRDALQGYRDGSYGRWFAEQMRASGDEASTEELVRDAQLAAQFILSRLGASSGSALR